MDELDDIPNDSIDSDVLGIKDLLQDNFLFQPVFNTFDKHLNLKRKPRQEPEIPDWKEPPKKTKSQKINEKEYLDSKFSSVRVSPSYFTSPFVRRGSRNHFQALYETQNRNVQGIFRAAESQMNFNKSMLNVLEHYYDILTEKILYFEKLISRNQIHEVSIAHSELAYLKEERNTWKLLWYLYSNILGQQEYRLYLLQKDQRETMLNQQEQNDKFTEQQVRDQYSFEKLEKNMNTNFDVKTQPKSFGLGLLPPQPPWPPIMGMTGLPPIGIPAPIMGMTGLPPILPPLPPIGVVGPPPPWAMGIKSFGPPRFPQQYMNKYMRKKKKKKSFLLHKNNLYVNWNKSHRRLVLSEMKYNPQLVKNFIVVKWLESIYDKPVNYFSDRVVENDSYKKKDFLCHTIERILSNDVYDEDEDDEEKFINDTYCGSGAEYGEDGDIVSEIDPDAVIREGKGIDIKDSMEENILLKKLWDLLRSGRLYEAERLCMKYRQFWRSAMFSGAFLYHNDKLDPLKNVFESAQGPNNKNKSQKTKNKKSKEEDCDKIIGTPIVPAKNYFIQFYKRILLEGLPKSDINSIVGNKKRFSFIANLWDLSESQKIKKVEKAIFSVLCGNIKGVLVNCKSYKDRLWAFMKTKLEYSINKVIKTSFERDLSYRADSLSSFNEKMILKNEKIGRNRFLSPLSIHPQNNKHIQSFTKYTITRHNTFQDALERNEDLQELVKHDFTFLRQTGIIGNVLPENGRISGRTDMAEREKMKEERVFEKVDVFKSNEEVENEFKLAKSVLEKQSKNPFLSNAQIFASLTKNNYAEANEDYNLIQKLIIMIDEEDDEEFEGFLNVQRKKKKKKKKKKVLNGKKRERSDKNSRVVQCIVGILKKWKKNTRLYEHFLRFSAHFVIFMTATSQIFITDDTRTDIIVKYIKHLIHTKQNLLVPMYTSTVAEYYRPFIYAKFLEHIRDSNVNILSKSDLECLTVEYLKAGECFKLDMIETIKRYVRNAKMQKGKSNAQKIEALRMFFYYGKYENFKEEALFSANGLIRLFVANEQYQDAYNVFLIISNFLKNNNGIVNYEKKKDADELDEEEEEEDDGMDNHDKVKNVLREYSSWKLYFSTRNLYNNYINCINNEKPIFDKSGHKGLSGRNQIKMEYMKKMFLEKMKKWRNNRAMKYIALKKSLYEYVVFSDGWLCDKYVYKADGEDEFKVMRRRESEMGVLRKKVVPEMMILMLDVMMCEGEYSEGVKLGGVIKNVEKVAQTFGKENYGVFVKKLNHGMKRNLTDPILWNVKRVHVREDIVVLDSVNEEGNEKRLKNEIELIEISNEDVKKENDDGEKSEGENDKSESEGEYDEESEGEYDSESAEYETETETGEEKEDRNIY